MSMGEYRAVSANPAGMTMRELRQFVQTAMRLDVDDKEPVHVIVKMNGGLKAITVVVKAIEETTNV